ncbi:MAG: T9SS type A sorting domain-containing protein, partial [Ignavibacteria bacterium]|nr:T9SS type A sorting domain-containing protein [Ignavibacteria bacterium]
WGVTTFFRGFIDDIRIYSSAKTNEEILALCHEGGWTVSVDNNPSPEQPDGYSLSQNYPNPFNPSTLIEFSLPRSQHVTLVVFDIMGRSVRGMIDGPLPAGNHSVAFETAGLSAGTYLYRIEAGDFSQSRRMTILK